MNPALFNQISTKAGTMAGVLKKFKSGEVIIAEGTVGKALYIIHSGKVEVTKSSKSGPVQLAALGPNEVFGEMSLIDDLYSHRTATVRALQDSEIIILDRKGFDAYLSQTSPGILNLIQRLSKRLRETNEIISRLGRSQQTQPKAPVLKDPSDSKEKLTYDQLVESVEAAVDLNLLPKKFKKDQVLIKENAEAMSLFLLKKGSVRVFKNLQGKEVEVDTLCANEVFGEIGMFDNSRRFATVKAAEDGEVVVFSKKQMDEMLRKAPLELFMIMEGMAQKVKRTTEHFLEKLEEKEKLTGENQKLKEELDLLKEEKIKLEEKVNVMTQKAEQPAPGSLHPLNDTGSPAGNDHSPNLPQP